MYLQAIGCTRYNAFHPHYLIDLSKHMSLNSYQNYVNRKNVYLQRNNYVNATPKI